MRECWTSQLTEAPETEILHCSDLQQLQLRQRRESLAGKRQEQERERERPDLSLIRDRCLRFWVNSSRLVFVAAESSSLAVERERGYCVVVSFSVASEEENARRREEKRESCR